MTKQNAKRKISVSSVNSVAKKSNIEALVAVALQANDLVESADEVIFKKIIPRYIAVSRQKLSELKKAIKELRYGK